MTDNLRKSNKNSKKNIKLIKARLNMPFYDSEGNEVIMTQDDVINVIKERYNLSITTNYYSNIENGKIPSTKLIAVLCDLFGLQISDFNIIESLEGDEG
ncbi:MAG TPA: helix-turn-helix transcriptional regulator [Bacillota bacterium]|jgi:hypothetical protein|nr:helix-turn-helix transcriptional regulator [Bacillota bacterium]HOL09889.1 helix-turn-helix transcriptional regulator [Bacillota bacterium]HPO98666.1 helix-turn-helix transcriptional regulator [Bacillota bacterium]